MTFSEALKTEYSAGRIPVIPDIKLISPKDGDLIRGRDPLKIAEDLVKAGAPVLSVVTEPKEFGGSLGLLEKIAEKVAVPVLRKDFVENVSDLDATVKAGAKAILLMCSCLDEEKLTFLYHEALKRGLTPFVETHSKEGLAFAASLNAELVGINNRDILQLEKDDGTVSCSAGLLRYAPKGAFMVSESSIRDAADVRKVVKSGANAVLAGTCIMNAADSVKKYLSLRRKAALKVCGIMDPKGLENCVNSAADLAGMVVEYPVDVPWNIRPGQAETIAADAKGKIRTCVVTGGSKEKVLELAERIRPDYIQLHYTETLEETAGISEALKKKGIGTIRSIPSNPELRKEMFRTKDPIEAATLLEKTDVEIILFDSRDASNAADPSGSILTEAKAIELSEFASGCSKQIMMGGGITAENASEVCRRLKPDIIDVMSSSEIKPGDKSEEKIGAIIASIGYGI